MTLLTFEAPGTPAVLRHHTWPGSPWSPKVKKVICFKWFRDIGAQKPLKTYDFIDFFAIIST